MRHITTKLIYCPNHSQTTEHQMFYKEPEYIFTCSCGHIVKWYEKNKGDLDTFLLDYKKENVVGSYPRRVPEIISDVKTEVVAAPKSWWRKFIDALND